MTWHAFWTRSRTMLRSVLAVLLLTFAAMPPRLAESAATSPTLALSAVDVAAVDGKRTLTFAGVFDFENALQVAYPLHLVVFRGTRFVRYPVVGPAVVGDSSRLADGVLSLGELNGFLGEGTPAPAGVRLVTLTPTGGVVTLPADLGSGSATAILFTVLPEEPVRSNPLTFVLP